MTTIAPIGTLDPTALANVDANPVGAPPSNSSLDKDAFLKLLVAQLKYQDPTAPTDVSQMMSQTSQLTMVERLDEIAEGIKALNGGGGSLSNAAGMLGREVTFEAGQPAPVTAIVDSVRVVDGATLLSAGGYDVPLDALVEVRSPTASAVAPAPLTPPAADAVEASHDHGHDHGEGATEASSDT